MSYQRPRNDEFALYASLRDVRDVRDVHSDWVKDKRHPRHSSPILNKVKEVSRTFYLRALRNGLLVVRGV